MINKIPKGTLILIGGAEDKGNNRNKNENFEHFEILKSLIPENKTKRKGIEIITTASSVPEEVMEMYKSAFDEIGYKNIGFINMGNNPDAHNPIFISRIKKAHAVLFSGGDQFRLATILGNTDVLDAVREKYINDPDFIVSGTSAGAMAIPTLMMYEGENNEAILKGTVKMSSGLGLLDGCIIDTHFTKRGRFGRLAQAVVMNPACVGIGVGEDTALVIKKGREAGCIGSGMVVIIDGKPVGHTNIAYAEELSPVCIEGLKVHILCKGNGFMLEDRSFIPSKKDLKEELKRTSNLTHMKPHA